MLAESVTQAKDRARVLYNNDEFQQWAGTWLSFIRLWLEDSPLINHTSMCGRFLKLEREFAARKRRGA
jgi:hypothetical protein